MAYAPDLIIDVGAHTGEDTAFYLAKGFKVVAVEACPSHVETLRQRFHSAIASGHLSIEDVAIGPSAGKSQFLIHKKKSDWHRAEIDERRFTLADFDVIEATFITLDSILMKHGTPYYLKVDIEGYDRHAIAALNNRSRPPFVSFEVSRESPELLQHLSRIGYRHFQIVDQSMHRKLRCPFPAREGCYVATTFSGHMSGLFGRELPSCWTPLDESLEQLESLSHEAPHWYDIHAAVSIEQSGSAQPHANSSIVS